MEKQEWEKLKERYAMFLTETGAFSCPYPWHEEVRLEEKKKAADLFLRMRRGRERSFLWEVGGFFPFPVSDGGISEYPYHGAGVEAEEKWGRGSFLPF